MVKHLQKPRRSEEDQCNFPKTAEILVALLFHFRSRSGKTVVSLVESQETSKRSLTCQEVDRVSGVGGFELLPRFTILWGSTTKGTKGYLNLHFYSFFLSDQTGVLERDPFLTLFWRHLDFFCKTPCFQFPVMKRPTPGIVQCWARDVPPEGGATLRSD